MPQKWQIIGHNLSIRFRSCFPHVLTQDGFPEILIHSMWSIGCIPVHIRNAASFLSKPAQVVILDYQHISGQLFSVSAAPKFGQIIAFLHLHFKVEGVEGAFQEIGPIPAPSSRWLGILVVAPQSQSVRHL